MLTILPVRSTKQATCCGQVWIGLKSDRWPQPFAAQSIRHDPPYLKASVLRLGTWPLRESRSTP
jgi:hypothetical protein